MGQDNPLEKGMATHSSILAGESRGQRSLEGYSPWGHKKLDRTERLTNTHCSMGLHRVGHDWGDLAAAAAAVVDIYLT